MIFLDVMRMFEILSPSSDQMSADQMFSSLLLLLISVLVGCLLLSAQWHSCVADLPLGIGQESAVNEMLKSCAGNITNLDIIPDRLCSVLCWIITWLHLHRPLCRCEVSASLIHPTGFLAWRREEELCNTVLEKDGNLVQEKCLHTNFTHIFLQSFSGLTGAVIHNQATNQLNICPSQKHLEWDGNWDSCSSFPWHLKVQECWPAAS